MPSILLFYNKLVDISLPKTIDEIFLNKTIINNYNYFKENPNELVNIQSMCFSISDVVFLYKIIKNNLEFFADEKLIGKAIERLSNQESFLYKLTKSETRNFFLIFETKFNPDKKNILQPEEIEYMFNNDIANAEFRLKKIKFCIKLILRSMNLVDSNICSQFPYSINTEKFFIILNKVYKFILDHSIRRVLY